MFIATNTRRPATVSSVFEVVEYFEWYFSKYYQVHGSRVFSDLVIYKLLGYFYVIFLNIELVKLECGQHKPTSG